MGNTNCHRLHAAREDESKSEEENKLKGRDPRSKYQARCEACAVEGRAMSTSSRHHTSTRKTYLGRDGESVNEINHRFFLDYAGQHRRLGGLRIGILAGLWRFPSVLKALEWDVIPDL